MKKNLLIAGLFLALAAAYFGYNMYNKTHKNLNEINADFVITPQDLLAEFDTDEAAAQTKYLNKIIKLNGYCSISRKWRINQFGYYPPEIR
jgi:hypothetical protein